MEPVNRPVEDIGGESSLPQELGADLDDDDHLVGLEREAIRSCAEQGLLPAGLTAVLAFLDERCGRLGLAQPDGVVVPEGDGRVAARWFMDRRDDVDQRGGRAELLLVQELPERFDLLTVGRRLARDVVCHRGGDPCGRGIRLDQGIEIERSRRDHEHRDGADPELHRGRASLVPRQTRQQPGHAPEERWR